ncbi:hypothetical protein Sjap_014504 [Stephania japonica]|uniref:LysM domain-containing protein n=1 Tax=Stephania japonica TaxID=461633 RepID=A0AAP0IHP3_9MAGN
MRERASHLTMRSSSSSSSSNVLIEHPVSRMDTLAGVAIMYGVDVADLKRMNGLVSDRQMYALKTLQIPLPGRHPPSTDLLNGSPISRDSSAYHISPRRAHDDLLESLHSLRLKSPQRMVSPAMSNLQGYYGLQSTSPSPSEDGMDMAVQRTNGVYHHPFEDGMPPKSSSLSEPALSRHQKSNSLANGLHDDYEDLGEDITVVEAEDCEAEKLNENIEKAVRRRQKTETGMPELLMKEENSSNGGFSGITGKGLALRPKSTSRVALVSNSDSSWLHTIPLGLGDSFITNGFDGVRKSSSTSNLPEQEISVSSSIWATSKWALKQDLQAALSAATIARPIFDGLPKPIAAWRSKTALD